MVGWGDDDNQSLDKLDTTTTLDTVFRSRVYNIGNKFQIHRIRIPLGADVAANMGIVPVVYLDDLSASVTLTAIDTTAYSGFRKVVYEEPGIPRIIGQNNFFI